MKAALLFFCALLAVIVNVDSFRMQALKKFIAVPMIVVSFSSGALADIGAESNDLPEGEIVPSQLVQFEKLDINNSPISDYKPYAVRYSTSRSLLANHHLQYQSLPLLSNLSLLPTF